jgi:cystathionine beta-lyase
MAHFDFDTIYDRKNTGSLKYDLVGKYSLPEDTLPMWVADMDFRSPECVVEAIIQRARHGIFGYSDEPRGYFDALEKWYRKRHNWQIHPSWLVKASGVVYALAQTVRALTEAGDAVLIQEPVYYPFRQVVEQNGRRLVVSELVYENGAYRVDFDDFERKIRENSVRLFILCSPHNPVSRVWTREELERMGEICLKYGVIVASDEIHADFVYPGYRHTVFAAVKPEFEQNSVILTAPTKTFNLAGLHISNIFIPNPALREKYKTEVARSGMSQLGIMGMEACKAAYEGGGEWLDALMEYLNGNLAFMRDFLRERLPELKLVEPEGTYLVWVDFSALGMSVEELERFIKHEARLWLDGGTMFGAAGAGFQRFNIACPRAILEEAMERLEKACRSRT